MMNNSADPTINGTSGLKGLNTKSGLARHLESLGFAKSVPEYKVSKIKGFEEPIQNVGSPSIGESMFDKDITSLTQLRDIENTRGELQPWYAQVAAGLGKGTVLAGTTFLNGTLGLVYGIGSALYNWKWSGLWDNDMSRALDNINKWSEEVMPNYYTEEEKNASFLQKLGTANFWADGFIKNIGFTVGAFYSGGIYTKGLGAALKFAKVGAKAGQATTTLTGSVISAVNEGSIEALHAADEFSNEYGKVLELEHTNNLAKIKSKYRFVPENLENPIYQQYLSEIENENNNYREALNRLEENKAKVGNSVLLGNVALLTASNFLQFGKLYSRGFNTARKTAKVRGELGKLTPVNKTAIEKTGRILKGGILEGGEEVEQQVISDVQKSYYAEDVNSFYKALQDPEASQETQNWFNTFYNTLGETLSQQSTWEQFFVGGLTGLVGMPYFREMQNDKGEFQFPIGIRESFISKWKELNNEAKENKVATDAVNNRFNSPEFKAYYQGLSRHNYYQNEMNDAVLRDDEFDYKNAEHAQLISDIVMFDRVGKLEDFKAIAGDALDTSDKNLEEIIRNTTTISEDGKLVGPYAEFAIKNADGTISPNFGNEASKQKMIEELSKDRDNLLKTIDNYTKIRKKLDNSTNYNLSDEQLDELTWMQSQLDNWSDRASEMSGQVKEVIGKVIGAIENKRRAAIAIRDFEGRKSAELTDTYKKADKVISIYSGYIDNLNTIRELDNKSAAATLAYNSEFLDKLVEDINKLDDDIINAEDRKDVLRKLEDINRLGNTAKIYSNKLTEYLFNSQKQEEAHREIDDKNIKEAENIEKAQHLESLNRTANFQEVQDLIDNGDATMDDLDKSSSESAKDFKKANLFRKKAISAINDSDSDYKGELLKMLDKRFRESSNYADLINDNIITELSMEASTLDSKLQETIENEFSNIIKKAKGKVESGNSQKEDVKSTTNPETKSVGKDDVIVPPETKPFTTKTIEEEIKDLGLSKEEKEQALTIINSINQGINEFEKSEDVRVLRRLQRDVNSLSALVGNKLISGIIDKVKSLSKVSPLNPSTLEQVADEMKAEAKYDQTAVSNSLKAVIPQFDLDAKRNGVLIDFVGEGRNEGFSYVYNRLNTINPEIGKSAFDYVNEGNVKKGDLLEVRYEEATNEHPELLALYHNGVLVNFMNTDEKIPGVKEIKAKAKKGEYTTVRVSKIMDGQYGFNRGQSQSIGDLLGTDNAVLGIQKGGHMVANTDTYIEPVFDSANSDGKVYILLPNSKGTLKPVGIYIRHLNKNEFDLSNQSGPIAEDLRKVFNKLADLPSASKNLDEALDNIYMDLIDLLYVPDSFHINITSRNNEIYLQIGFNNRDNKRVNKNILLKRFASKSLLHIGAGESKDIQDFTPNRDDLYNQILDAFYEANLAFNINAKKLSGKKGNEYANRLRNSNVLFTYLTGKKMLGTWFMLNEEFSEEEDKGRSENYYHKLKESEKNKGGTRVSLNTKEYFVRGGNIYDTTGSIIDLGDNNQLILDLAYIESAYGPSYFGANQHDGKVLIVDKNGKRGYDRRTNKYLSEEEVNKLETIIEGRKTKAEETAISIKSLSDSQKLVLRDPEGNPDTSNGSYRILEDDGQYHDYQRVHSVIGSNYVGPSKGDSATSVGNSIDTISRQFFIDSTNVSKPENMSEESFRALLKGLGQFREDTNKRGLRLITDRTVVFHKYPDGRRIAGELDVLAYNPDTGEINIFDFKTSKYSTRDTSFSKVTRPNLFIRSTKDQYSLQLNAYSELLKDEFNINISNLIIVPFQVSYKKGEITRITPEKYVALDNKNKLFKQYAEAVTSDKKTFKGQYVTMGTGKPEFHTAEMRELFTTKKGTTFYIAEVDNKYKLILPNGRSIALNGLDITDDEIGLRADVMQLISSDETSDMIKKLLETDPLENSPYGNSIKVESIEDTTDNRDERDLEILNRFNNLKPKTTSSQSEKPEDTKGNSSNQKEGKKYEVKIDVTTARGKELLSSKQWSEITQEEKDFIIPIFTGMTEEDIAKYWDSIDAVQRELSLSCK